MMEQSGQSAIDPIEKYLSPERSPQKLSVTPSEAKRSRGATPLNSFLSASYVLEELTAKSQSLLAIFLINFLHQLTANR